MVLSDYHTPVLLYESIEGLALEPDGIYVDLTYGGGGHSREITKHLKSGRLIAFDQDPAVKGNLISDRKFCFVRHNYRYFKNFLQYMGISKVDGILADLGVSSEHLDNPERGFSFRFDAFLDMRMNPGLEETAADIINNHDEQDLARILREYGELESPGRLASRLAEARQSGKISRTSELADCLRPMFPRNRENKMLAQVFQAFRIAVNREIDSLADMLVQTAGMLRPGGRLVVISYHSLEDRLVKNIIRGGNPAGEIRKDLYGNLQVPYRAVNRKVIVPPDNEVQANPRARSARLRIGERTDY